MSDTQLAAREFLLAIDRAEAGTHLYPGFVPKFHTTPSEVRTPAPCFGQHNADVFGRILGLSAEDIQQLESERIISQTPLLP